MKVPVSLIKIFLALLGLTAAVSAIDEGIKKKLHDSRTKTSIISNEETISVMKTAQIFEDSNI